MTLRGLLQEVCAEADAADNSSPRSHAHLVRTPPLPSATTSSSSSSSTTAVEEDVPTQAHIHTQSAAVNLRIRDLRRLDFTVNPTIELSMQVSYHVLQFTRFHSHAFMIASSSLCVGDCGSHPSNCHRHQGHALRSSWRRYCDGDSGKIHARLAG